MKAFYLILIFLSSLLVAVFANADTLLEFETNDSRLPNTIIIKREDIRLGFVNQPLVVLFNRGKNRLTFLHQDNKTYFQVNEKNFKRIAKSVQKLQLPTDSTTPISAAQQDKLEKIFSKEGLEFNPTARLYTYQKVGSSVYKGVTCDVVTVFIQEQQHSNHCLASARYIGINGTDFKTYLYLLAFLKSTAIAVPILDPLIQQGFSAMPIISQDTSDSVFRKFFSVTAHNIDKSLFAIPKDYKKVKQLSQL